jgi:hydrogenase maturation protease
MMEKEKLNVLFYGYGNPGREDDGLGAAFTEEISNWALDHDLNVALTVDQNYQLNVEDAKTMAEHDVVIFVDATKEEIEDYSFEQIMPSPEASFTMHSVSPEYLFHLCISLFEQKPLTYVLSIKGYHWEFREGLSPKAKENLEKALNFIKKRVLWEDLLIQLDNRS